MSLPFDVALLNDYLIRYINLVPSSMQLLEALDYSHHQLLQTLHQVDEEKAKFSYQPNKWSIKTMVMHITDADRIFQYRALSIARGEQQNLPGFNENEFAKNAYANELLFSNIVKEYKLVAEGFRVLFENLQPSTLSWYGTANGTKLSPMQIGFIAAGHRLHHVQVLNEKYFK